MYGKYSFKKYINKLCYLNWRIFCKIKNLLKNKRDYKKRVIRSFYF